MQSKASWRAAGTPVARQIQSDKMDACLPAYSFSRSIPVPSDTITAETRHLLGQLRDLLLDQHKTLLDRERLSYEKTHGAIGGPGVFLRLVLEDPHFAWLKQISTLVVNIDEALSPKSQADETLAQSLVNQARETMRPREKGADFQARYYRAMQDSPDIVILQCRIEQLLGI